MEITIKKLTAELSADYFDFFDNRAFTDNSPYRCYCQMYQLSREQGKKLIENTRDIDPGPLSKMLLSNKLKQVLFGGI